MALVPKKVQKRIADQVKKYKPILKTALEKDINEADTVTIVKDMLSDIFGYDKYADINSEHKIRGTYCDLALQVDERMLLLVEVKAIGIDLKEGHTKQVVDYGANKGCEWVALTNGIKWIIYKIHFGKPIDKKLVIELDFPEINPRNESDMEHMYLLSKEGRAKSALKDFHSAQQATSKYMIGAIIRRDTVVSVIKRELRKITPDVKLDSADIEAVIISEVLKRDVVEGELAEDALKKVNRILNKKTTPKRSDNETNTIISE
jgi:hypothetical protein